MKALRIVLFVLGGVLALLVIAAVVLIKSFDPNDYKDEITAYVQERTGRTLVIGDDIALSLFPWFAVETGDLTLSDDPAFGERDFVSVEEISARVRVWPLLKRRVEIGRVVLDGVDLNLGTDPEGRGNWSSLLETTAPGAPATPAAAPDRPSIEQLAVEGIALRNARILWYGPDGEVRYIVRDLNLETGRIRDSEPVDVDLGFSLLDVASQASAEISLESVASIAPEPRLEEISATIRVLDSGEEERAGISLDLGSIVREGPLVRASSADLTASLIRPPVGADVVDVAIAFEAIELDTSGERLAVTGLSMRSGGIESRWTLDGESVLSGPRVSGSVRVSGRSVAELTELLGAALPASVDAAGLGDFDASADFTLAATPLAADVLRFDVAALGIAASGNAGLRADGSVTARIDVPAFEPSPPVLALLGTLLPPGSDPGAIASMSAAASLLVAADRERIEATDFAVTLDAARVSGRLAIVEPASPTAVSGSITASRFDSGVLEAVLGDLLPSDLLAAELGELRLATDFEVSPGSGTGRFDPLELTAYGLSADGTLAFAPSDDGLALSGQARLDEFSPRELLARFELPVPESSDPGALTSARLAASFDTSGSSGRFYDIVVDLDDSRITGEFGVENFADPEYAFVLRADTIDVDRYLPPADTPAAAGAAGAAAAGADSAEGTLGDLRLASEPLTATAIAGTASVGDLVIGGMRFEQFATELAVGDGRLALSSVQTRLYGGEFSGGFEIDATAAAPTIHLTGTATDLSMRPLLEAMLGDANLSGTGNFRVDLTGAGSTVGEAMQSAAGMMNVSFRDGTISGLNVGRSLCAAVNRARELPAPQAAPDATQYSLIRASATVSDGIARSSDLYATTGYIELTGSGTMRLVDQWLDTDFVARLVGPIPLAGCERLNSQVDDSIPIGFGIEGKLPDVDYSFDVRELIEDWIRREIRNQAEDAVRDRLQDALRGLLD